MGVSVGVSDCGMLSLKSTDPVEEAGLESAYGVNNTVHNTCV